MPLVMILPIILGHIGLVFLLGLSGAGYGYFNSDYVFTNCQINYRIMFGCGIGVAMLLLLAVNSYFAFSKWGHYFTTFVFTLAIGIVYLVFTTSTTKCVTHHEKVWYSTDTGVTDFQLKHNCCGWLNSSDHALSNCPFNFDSGCKTVMANYLAPRVKQIFIGTILFLILTFGSLMFSCILTFVLDIDSIYENAF